MKLEKSVKIAYCPTNKYINHTDEVPHPGKSYLQEFICRLHGLELYKISEIKYFPDDIILNHILTLVPERIYTWHTTYVRRKTPQNFNSYHYNTYMHEHEVTLMLLSIPGISIRKIGRNKKI